MDTESRLATVESHAELCNRLLERMEKSLDKMTDICQQLNTIVAVHESRLDALGALQQQDHDDVKWHSKYLWMAVGAITFVATVAGIIFKAL